MSIPALSLRFGDVQPDSRAKVAARQLTRPPQPNTPRFGDEDHMGPSVETHNKAGEYFQEVGINSELAKRSDQLRNQAILKGLALPYGEGVFAKDKRLLSAKWELHTASFQAARLLKKEQAAKKTAKIPG